MCLKNYYLLFEISLGFSISSLGFEFVGICRIGID